MVPQVFHQHYTEEYIQDFIGDGIHIAVDPREEEWEAQEAVLKMGAYDGKAMISKGWVKVIKAANMEKGDKFLFHFSTGGPKLKCYLTRLDV